MARPLRVEMADGVYHVTSRGLERRHIVRDDGDRQRWLHLLGEVAGRRGWRVLAWALMTNHFHLFVRTPEPDLSAGLHDLNSAYATGFNRRHRRRGPLYQGRFKAVLVEREGHYWELSRYVHLNPVRAGIVADAEDYAWSSFAAYVGRATPPDWLAWQEVLGEYGRTLRGARRAYRAFVSAGAASKLANPLDGAVAGTLLGSDGFVQRMKRWLQDRLPDGEVPAARQLRRAAPIDDIVACVCRVYGVSPGALAERGRHHNEARQAAIYLCRRLTRTPVAQIGARFGGVHASRVTHIVDAVTYRRSHHRETDALLADIEDHLAEN